jgi:hypothetical protein
MVSATSMIPAHHDIDFGPARVLACRLADRGHGVLGRVTGGPAVRDDVDVIRGAGGGRRACQGGDDRRDRDQR